MTEKAAPYSGLMLDSDDHVALALTPLAPGDIAKIKTTDGDRQVEISEAIPRYHKFTVRALSDQTPVIKGGEMIGVTTADVRPGCHLHTHNIKSIRYGVS
ncbi:UxaA family hydrolase [Martelella sp. AMO21009]